MPGPRRERQKSQMEDYRTRVDDMSFQLSQLSTEKSSLVREFFS